MLICGCKVRFIGIKNKLDENGECKYDKLYYFTTFSKKVMYVHVTEHFFTGFLGVVNSKNMTEKEIQQDIKFEFEYVINPPASAGRFYSAM